MGEPWDSGPFVDVFHCNSIDVDPANGNLLVSCRNMVSIFYVERSTGKVLWKMGGKRASLDNATYVLVEDPFFRQHDARLQLGWSADYRDGGDDEARKVAEDFRARSESWSANSAAKGLDLSLWLLRLSEGRGGLSPEEFERRRAVWIDQRLTTSGAFPGLVWTFAYGATAITAGDAEIALAAVPKFAPLTSFWRGSLSPDAYAGHVHLLAGHAGEAVFFLERAVANCTALLEPFVYVRAALDLGLALEGTDRTRACSAYKLVLDRWGHARPRSVTADKAKERSRALGCGR